MKKYLWVFIVLGIALYILWKKGKLDMGGLVKTPQIFVDRQVMRPDKTDPSKITLGDPKGGW